MEALRERLEGMTAQELRAFSKTPEGRALHGLRGTDLAPLTTKDALISAMIGGAPETPTSKPTNGGNGNGSMDLAAIIAQAVQGHIQTPIDENTVNLLIDRRIQGIKPAPKTIEIHNIETGKKTNLGLQHKDFEKLLTLAQVGYPVMLVGPAGSGKTTVCRSVAEALGRDFYYQAVGPQTSEAKLVGYTDANREYQSTPLREAYENGGVILLDEIDAGNPGVLTVLNAMLENGGFFFPDSPKKMVKQHKDFFCFAAANTYGHGANSQYIGRNPIDGATRKRFVMVNFGYDEDLERSLANNDEWVNRVQLLRRTVEKMRELVIISPRESIRGAVLLAAGIPQDDVEDMIIWQGASLEIVNRIKGGANNAY